MPFLVYPMLKEDVAQVSAIDREAFPTQWREPSSYEHELQNKLARYSIVCDETKTVSTLAAESEKVSSRLVPRIRRWFGRNYFSSSKAPSPGSRFIAGFGGIWVMADEAHITNIAVRMRYQRRGIGELLLIHLIGQTKELKAEFVTLEVRVSNTTAQNLYRKYGFVQTGLRRGYYTDNWEDGVIMSTESINSASFQSLFQQLKEEHSRRWGYS